MFKMKPSWEIIIFIITTLFIAGMGYSSVIAKPGRAEVCSMIKTSCKESCTSSKEFATISERLKNLNEKVDRILNTIEKNS